MKILVAALAFAGTALVGLSAVADAQPYGPGPGYGSGQGYGGGPGYGPGPGYGRGPMMGGPGWGPGMMRGGPQAGCGGQFALSDLTDDQQAKIARIQEENRARNWETMGQLRGEQFKLRQMHMADRLDSDAYLDQQRKVDELRRSLLKSRIEARNQIDALLTKEQRQQFRSVGPWCLQSDVAD
jgi:Spy/CpxP family protein refolding chaperone